MGKTTISWTDLSWPVVNGCRRTSPGCENCYAERLAATRLRNTPKYSGLAVVKECGPQWTGQSRLWTPSLDLPLRTRKPSRIFVADMGDLFYEEVSDEEIAAIFGVMAACPRHTFQVLTKRADRMRRWFEWVAEASRDRFVGPALAEHAACWYQRHDQRSTADLLFRSADLAAGRPWPLPNVHLGVSVETQKYLDERVPLLLETPAAVRWISAEPLLGPIDVSPYLRRTTTEPARFCAISPEMRTKYGDDPQDIMLTRSTRGLDWVVGGGESGPRARPNDLGWSRALRDQCAAAGVAYFQKQLGARPYERVDSTLRGYSSNGDLVPLLDGAPERRPPDGWTWIHIAGKSWLQRSHGLTDKKGEDPMEWPEDLRIRQFPTAFATKLP